MRVGWMLSAFLAVALPAHAGRAQDPLPDYRTAAAQLGARVVENAGLTVSQMALGGITLDTNRFTALVSNASDSARILGLTLRTEAGLWIRANWQRGFRFEIPAHTQRTIEVAYVFRRMTPEARLRIGYGTPLEVSGGISVVERFYDTTVAVGRDNPAATDPRVAFDTARSEHFEVFGWRGSSGARRLVAVATERERALQRVAEMLAVRFTGEIRLVLYPDSATKTSQTGHIGAGFASGRTIVEIYNDSVQMDPYHEIAHIVGEERGSPPALLDEGFAVYASESLGADALKQLGSPGKTANQASCGFLRTGQAISLNRLFRFTDIGSDSTHPAVAYPEAASIVSFLIETYGLERFRDLYARLRNSEAEVEQRRNRAILQDAYGLDLGGLERAWRAWLKCPR